MDEVVENNAQNDGETRETDDQAASGLQQNAE
jgi:hypothetical protein